MSTINVSTEAYNAIRQAIDTVYARTGRKPKYSEVQALYKTSNSYIQAVMVDWMEEHKDDLAKPTAESQPIELDQATIQAVTSSFIAELQKAKDQAESELEQERQALYAIRDEAVDEMTAQMQIADDRLVEISLLTERVEEADKQLSVYKALCNDWQGKYSELDAVSSRQASEIKRIQSRNDDLDSELIAMRKQLSETQSKATQTSLQLEEMQGRAKRLESELQVKIDQLAERDSTISTLSAENLEDKQKLAELKGTVTALQTKSN